MNTQELIEMLRIRSEAVKDIELDHVILSQAEAADLLRELEGDHYKSLLVKYINHVEYCEGVNFLMDRNMYKSDFLTEDEFRELQKLAEDDLPQPPKT